jgi:hypothetical protein
VLHYLSDNTPGGAWLKIEMPYKIKLNSFSFVTGSRDYSTECFPENFQIWASNNGTEWNQIYSVSGFGNPPNETGGTIWGHTNVDSQKGYSKYAMVITKLYMVGTETRTFASIPRWKLFGTREQRQSVLHDGQLTLTKNLDVPRIGPPLDADDTPRRDRLVVEYNTSSNPTFEGAVRDTSGRGNDGVFYNGAYYDATEKALVFDGTDDYVRTNNLKAFVGDQAHTIGGWFKRTNTSTARQDWFVMGTPATGQATAFSIYTSGDDTYAYGYSNDIYSTTNQIPDTSWYHVMITFVGGVPNTTNKKVYINGVDVTSNFGNGTATQTQNFGSDSYLTLGIDLGLSSHPAAVKISNFKLYDTALTASEVKTLYDMGRTGSVANPQPLHIAAPLYAPGVPVQIVSKVYKKQASYGSTSSYRNIKELDISIKPKFANSKILLHWMINGELHQDNVIRVARDGSYIIHGYNETQGLNRWSGIAAAMYDQNEASTPHNFCIDTYDEPGGTNTYNYQIYIGSSSTTSYPAYINRTYDSAGANAYEAGICFMSATEIAQ